MFRRTFGLLLFLSCLPAFVCCRQQKYGLVDPGVAFATTELVYEVSPQHPLP
jgi:hypothetical protein